MSYVKPVSSVTLPLTNNGIAVKPTCQCGTTMTFLMDKRYSVIWECPNPECKRLLLAAKSGAWKRWYLPEREGK